MTLHPTYAVSDGSPPRINSSTVSNVAEVIEQARSLALQVRLEPHLDWTETLTGGPYEWRRRMFLDPSGEYFETVLAPLASLHPDELTVGSELDVSAYEFAGQWSESAARLRGLTRAAIGHKLNHDWYSARDAVRREANIERSSRGLPERWPWGYGDDLQRYLSELDFLAVSYYPSGEWNLPEAYTIGEFGLGSTDIARPWHFDATTFQTPADFAIRRNYYQRFLAWLATRTGRAACFWTAGHFDILGIMQPKWRDDAIVEAVRAYNQASP